MISGTDQQRPHPRSNDNLTSTANLPNLRRRSLSPRPNSTTSNRLAQMATRTRTRETETVCKDNDQLHELIQRMEQIEKRTTFSEQRHFSMEERLLSTEEQVQQINALIEENKKLHDTVTQLTTALDTTKRDLETAHAKIAQMESTHHNPDEIYIEDSDMDLDGSPRTTKDSVHALSDKEWAERKAEIAKSRNQVAAVKEKQLQKQLSQLDYQQQQHQQKELRQRQPQRHQQKFRYQQTSYAMIASKNLPQKKRNTRPPTEKMLNWAHRMLQPAKANTAYTVVYIPSSRRTLHSEIRHALRLVGIAQERIIDIHFPAHGTVGLLIHSSYEQELRELLSQAKLHTKDDFDPTDATTIGDPILLAKLTKEERANEAKKLYQERLFTLCLRMPKKHLGIAILRHFTSLPPDNIHHIDSKYWEKFQEQNPKSLHTQKKLSSIDDAHKLLSSIDDNNNDKPELMEEQ